MFPATPLWDSLHALEGATVSTLDEEQPFLVEKVSSEGIAIFTSTGEHQVIPRSQIEAVWQHLVRTETMSLSEVAQYSPHYAAYVAAILSRMPEVSYTLDPITLILA